MSKPLILHPWDVRVGGGYGRVELSVQGDKIDVRKVADAGTTSPDGWFAIYERDVFGVFMMPDSKEVCPALLLKGRVWKLSSDVQLSGRHDLARRTFTLNKQGESVRLDYQRLWWNLFRRPVFAFSQVMFVDDWWGVVCDLPGWVESGWKTGAFAETLVKSLRERVVTRP